MRSKMSQILMCLEQLLVKGLDNCDTGNAGTIASVLQIYQIIKDRKNKS